MPELLSRRRSQPSKRQDLSIRGCVMGTLAVGVQR
jgi:hypothetical protein